MGTNIRESLYQCLENKITSSSSDASTVLLFKVSSNKNFAIRLYLNVSIYDPKSSNNKYDSLVQITFSNGNVHWGNSDTLLPYFKINQANIYTQANSISMSSITFKRVEDTDKHIYSYFAQIKANTTVGMDILVRKEILFGEFEELLSRTDSTSLENSDVIVSVNKTINDTSNGQYMIGAEDNTYVHKLIGKMDTDGNSSELTGFVNIAGDNISANKSIKLGDYFSASSTGITCASISTTGKLTAGNTITGTDFALPNKLFSINTSGELSGKYIGISTTDIEPSSTSTKVVLEKDLCNVKTLTKLTKIGTINSGTWEGTAISSGYIDSTLSNKTLITPYIQFEKDGTTQKITDVCVKTFNNDTLSEDSNSVPSTALMYKEVSNITTSISNATTSINNNATSITSINNYLTQTLFEFDSATKSLTITGRSSST